MPLSFDLLSKSNLTPAVAGSWFKTFWPGGCAGAGTNWRTMAPRWMKLCPDAEVLNSPQTWTEASFVTPPFPRPTAMSANRGDLCDWHVKQPDGFPAGCYYAANAEWELVTSNTLQAEGVVTNSFLSGGDWSGDHYGAPNGSKPILANVISGCKRFTILCISCSISTSTKEGGGMLVKLR